MIASKASLFWAIDSEGFYYYFSKYGPELPENVPDDIRDDWIDAMGLAADLATIEERLMDVLEKAADEEDDE